MQASVGLAIRTYRKRLGWDQEALAKKAKLNKGTINRIELGGNATVDTLLKIAHTLGVGLDLTLKHPDEEAQRITSEPPVSATSGDVLPPVTGARNIALAPGEELVPVPTATHRALYHTLAALPLSEINDLVTLVAERLARHNKGTTKEATTEAHPQVG